ncbi:hypothetical protein V6N11_071268 [Hibiscus sabdariffa]|uniref:Uncharacterized protein n=1 Tax=Hibiscus sabdariffa TaxID=183260 RepID=A0ABR2TZM1_9ROSI
MKVELTLIVRGRMAQETNQLTNQKMSWAEVVKVAHLVVSDQKSQSPLEERIIGDLEDMGSGKNEISPELVVNGSSETFCPNLVDESGVKSKEKPYKDPTLLDEAYGEMPGKYQIHAGIWKLGK